MGPMIQAFIHAHWHQPLLYSSRQRVVSIFSHETANARFPLLAERRHSHE